MARKIFKAKVPESTHWYFTIIATKKILKLLSEQAKIWWFIFCEIWIASIPQPIS